MKSYPNLRRRKQRGMSLIELMISMVLGLIIAGGAISVFIANKETYRITESLGRLQENARLAFEVMVREIREAGGNPCENGLDIANVLNTPGTNWYTNFGAGVMGYDGATAAPGLTSGSGAAQRVAGTDAIDLFNSTSGVVNVVSHQPTSARFEVNTVNHGISDGDIVMICDFDHAAITQITNAQPGTNANLVHNTGTGTPGNCTKGLGLPVVCTSNGTSYEYGPNSMIARMQPRRWYIGNNGRGGRSLYQTVLRNSSGTLSTQALEIAEGVQDMQLSYLQAGGASYVAAGSVTDWEQVRAVRVQLVMVPPAAAAEGSSTLSRTFEHVVTLRNHAP